MFLIAQIFLGAAPAAAGHSNATSLPAAYLSVAAARPAASSAPVPNAWSKPLSFGAPSASATPLSHQQYAQQQQQLQQQQLQQQQQQQRLQPAPSQQPQQPAPAATPGAVAGAAASPAASPASYPPSLVAFVNKVFQQTTPANDTATKVRDTWRRRLSVAFVLSP